MCKSYKYNLLPNIAMPTDVHGKYILHLRQSIYWRSHLILSISRLTSWPILKNVTRLGSRYISKRGFLMFKIIASISWCLLWLTKTKQKKIEGLVHVRVVHLSYPTGLSPTDWSSLFCPSPHSLVISATFVKTWVRNVPM